MPPSHPYKDIPIANDAPFELKPSPGKGWGCFAKTNIAEGSLIYREEPLLVVPRRLSQATEADIHAAVNQLGERERRIYSWLRKNGDATKKYTYYRDALSDNYHQLKKLSKTHSHLYVVHSRFNHSCVPNMKVVHNPNNVQLESYAFRDIMAGEEITFSYWQSLYKTSAQRREMLQEVKSFVCDCRACVPGTAFQEQSDSRRRLLRGLKFLRIGKDPEERENSPDRYPLIFDAQLKQDIANKRVPKYLEFICMLLGAFLSEKEGFLGYYKTIGDVEKRFPKFVDTFGTANHKEIARHALSQETWWKKFCEACKLYGRVDANDGSQIPWPHWGDILPVILRNWTP
ncbi:hypothetical protein HYFRA_00008027 [Hymenoscyphus fraxineus]|uniref:SET domain-containing protein n=1 Tax=Hymenoscyphus fraxineus TaxID=746836 RepID=A0A9N9PQ82_9HELO|nr:hypothetical protein HYFRA_00008027 [Hymenoscyphus fraxineus]